MGGGGGKTRKYRKREVKKCVVDCSRNQRKLHLNSARAQIDIAHMHSSKSFNKEIEKEVQPIVPTN